MNLILTIGRVGTQIHYFRRSYSTEWFPTGQAENLLKLKQFLSLPDVEPLSV